MRALRTAFASAKDRLGGRIVHYSVQSNHVHLLVEVVEERSLTRAMQGLSIRIARGLNRELGRKGSVFADRYHARALVTPREVRLALAYVLSNHRRHAPATSSVIDPCSTGDPFDGWSGSFQRGPSSASAGTVVSARTWLLSRGWRRWGPIDPSGVPGRR
jgi:hypothetical protein